MKLCPYTVREKHEYTQKHRIVNKFVNPIYIGAYSYLLLKNAKGYGGRIQLNKSDPCGASST